MLKRNLSQVHNQFYYFKKEKTMRVLLSMPDIINCKSLPLCGGLSKDQAFFTLCHFLDIFLDFFFFKYFFLLDCTTHDSARIVPLAVSPQTKTSVLSPDPKNDHFTKSLQSPISYRWSDPEHHHYHNRHHIFLLHFLFLLFSFHFNFRWLITLESQNARYKLFRDGLSIKGERVFLRRYDDVNYEDYRDFLRRKNTLQSDAHTAVQRLLSL